MSIKSTVLNEITKVIIQNKIPGFLKVAEVSLVTTSLPVMEAFYTIQGEGFFQGNAAYFIRLAGCDVGCFWCDVKDSWDVEKHPLKNIDQIAMEAAAYKSRLP